jgi:hypothetical protein
VPTPRVKEFETQFYRFLETERPEILKELGETNALTDEISAGLDDAIERFRVEAFGMDATKPAAKPEAAPPDEGDISASPAPPVTQAAVDTAAKNAEAEAEASATPTDETGPTDGIAAAPSDREMAGSPDQPAADPAATDRDTTDRGQSA